MGKHRRSRRKQTLPDRLAEILESLPERDIRCREDYAVERVSFMPIVTAEYLLPDYCLN